MVEGKLPSLNEAFSATSGRATPAEVQEQAWLCLDDPIVQAVLEALDCYAVILNAQRQILAANPALLEAMKQEGPEACRGLRLGEVLGCTNANEGFDGCGSSSACKHCGSLLSMLATHASGQMTEGECLIVSKQEGRWKSQEFVVRSKSITVAGHGLTLLTLRDISAIKRRETLERIFIHDFMDSIQAMRGWTEVMQGAGADATAVAEQVLELAGKFATEVESQHRLLQAERGELIAELSPILPAAVIAQIEGSLGAKAAARLVLLPLPQDMQPIHTDPAILGGILRDMVLNALEATPTGGQIRIWYEMRSGCPTFVVENPGCVPPDALGRVFQRSYSTKANRGRGLGTYSMKVLGERVLGGQVGFTTHWEDGTRFFIELPKEAS
jgi:signal transduction histidine kinase